MEKGTAEESMQLSTARTSAGWGQAEYHLWEAGGSGAFMFGSGPIADAQAHRLMSPLIGRKLFLQFNIVQHSREA